MGRLLPGLIQMLPLSSLRMLEHGDPSTVTVIHCRCREEEATTDADDGTTAELSGPLRQDCSSARVALARVR